MPGLEGTQKLLLAFVILLIGIVLVGPLAAQGNLVTDKTIVDGETVSVAAAKIHGDDFNATVDLGPITNVPTSWKIEDCPLTTITVTNNSGEALTVTTDYTLSTTTGVLAIVNNSDTTAAFAGDNSSLVGYTHCADDYLNVSWGRTGIDTAMGFFGLALMLVSVALFYSIYKDYGITQ